MKQKNTRKIAQYGCMLAFAMIASYLEAILPIHISIPGTKLGLANTAIVYCMYLFGTGPALIMNVCRVLLCGVLFGNLYSLLYSLAGAIFSFAIMALLKRFKCFSIMGVSLSGGVMHNVGQLCVAYAVTKVPVLFYYLPVLVIIGAITGLLNGFLAKIIYDKTKTYVD